MPVDVVGKVTEKRLVARDTIRIAIDAPEVAKDARPGQFVMICHTTPTFDPFLRRPFAITGAEWGRIELIIRVVGWGSALLANLSEGEEVRILGPLGNGFPNPEGGVILAAGGIGIAPLLFASRRWPSAELLYGESSLDWVCDLSRESFCRFELSTDDGSAGEKCNVVKLLRKRLAASPMPVFACGPEPMLEAVAKACKRAKVDCFVSLEERMACGVGACQGCAVLTKDGYKRVCKDGPVFDARKIEWGKR